MGYWKTRKEERDSSQEEYNIDDIDQAVFDDPVLLLEYLEKRELNKSLISSSNRIADIKKPYATDNQGQRSMPYYVNESLSGLYGYRTINGHISINPQEVPLIEEIFSLYDDGYSYTQIANKLKLTKYRTTTGKTFYPAAVQAIIAKRKIYEGETGYPPILKKKTSGNAVLKNSIVDHRGSGRSGFVYGYNKTRNAITINPKEADAVKKIFTLFDAGHNWAQIVSRLRYSTHRTTTGKLFYPAAVQAIIEKRNVYEGETGYPPIIQKNSRSDQRTRKESDYLKIERTKQPENRQQSLDMKKVDTSLIKPTDGREETSVDPRYNKVDDYLKNLRERGIPIKDNRWNDGCVWVKADPAIDKEICKIKIRGRSFRYAAKCRAFNGEAGWYY